MITGQERTARGPRVLIPAPLSYTGVLPVPLTDSFTHPPSGLPHEGTVPAATSTTLNVPGA